MNYSQSQAAVFSKVDGSMSKRVGGRRRAAFGIRCLGLFIVLTALVAAEVPVIAPIEAPKGTAENIARRTYTSKVFEGTDGSNTFVFSPIPIHYEDARGQFQDIDLSMTWDAATNTWGMTHAPYRLAVPQYADEWMTFTNAYQGADQTIRTRALCNHVLGNKTETENASQISYPNAFGPGKSLVIQANWSGFQRLIVMDSSVSADSDLNFDFQLDMPAADPVRAVGSGFHGPGAIHWRRRHDDRAAPPVG